MRRVVLNQTFTSEQVGCQLRHDGLSAIIDCLLWQMTKVKEPQEDPVVEDVEDDDDDDDDSDDVPDLEEADGSGRGKQSKMEKKSR